MSLSKTTSRRQSSKLPHLQGYLKHWETGLFRDGWVKRWLLLEADKLFLFSKESDLEHSHFVDLSKVVSVAPVENAFGTATSDQFGFKITGNDGSKSFFLAKDHKEMWFWVTGVVKWVNHIAKAYSRDSASRIDLAALRALKKSDAAHNDQSEEIVLVKKESARSASVRLGEEGESYAERQQRRRASKQRSATESDVQTVVEAPSTPKMIQAGPIEMVRLRDNEEIKTIDVDPAVDAMRERIIQVLPSVDSVNFDEARAILLAARSVDEEFNAGSRSALSSSYSSDRSPSLRMSVASQGDEDETLGDEELRALVGSLRADLKATQARLQAVENKANDGEQRRAFVQRVSNERIAGLRRELDAVALAREHDVQRWRRKTFDALLLLEQPHFDGDKDLLFEQLQAEVSPEGDLEEWRAFLTFPEQ